MLGEGLSTSAELQGFPEAFDFVISGGFLFFSFFFFSFFFFFFFFWFFETGFLCIALAALELIL